MNKVVVRNYQLRTENGRWLAQMLLSSDGMISGVTDYGNFAFAWRSFGVGDFRDFLTDISVDYFGGKLYQGMSYMASGKKYQNACMRLSEEVLPSLQKALREELETERLAGVERLFTLDEMKACALAMANWGEGFKGALTPNQYFKHHFEIDVSGAKNEKKDLHNDSVTDVSVIELKIDRASLPQDGQKIKFCIEAGEWLTGEFIESENMFWVTASEWHYAWKVTKWQPV